MHIHRQRLDELKKWHDEPEALIILGPRQVGKTTLVKQYLKWVEQEKGIPSSHIFSYNLEFVEHSTQVHDQKALVDQITAISGEKSYSSTKFSA